MEILEDYPLCWLELWIVFLIQNLHHTEFYTKHLHQKFITVNKFFNETFYLFHDTAFNFLVVACAMTRKEILDDWAWIFSHVCETLHSFDNEEDITNFVTCKIESVIATMHEVEVDGEVQYKIFPVIKFIDYDLQMKILSHLK